MIFIFSVNGIECSSSLFLEKILIFNFCYYCFCFITIFKANGCSNCSPLLLAGNNWIVMLKSSFTFFYQALGQKVLTEKIWKELQPKNGKFEILGLLLKLYCLDQRYIGDISPTPVSPISYRHSNIQCGDHKKCFFLQNTKKHKLVKNYFHKKKLQSVLFINIIITL